MRKSSTPRDQNRRRMLEDGRMPKGARLAADGISRRGGGVLKWANHVDSWESGVGPQYANCWKPGCRTVKELAPERANCGNHGR
jgi:hypothetical protein